MAEWDADIEVDADRARRLIEAQFAELRGVPIRPLATGWDNAVFVVDDRWAFRFPRRAIAVPGVEREIEALPRLAGHLPLPIPEPAWIGGPADDYPWPWFGAPLLPGVELADAGLADDDRVDLARDLGAFLRALHDPSLARLVGTSLPVDPNRRADMALRVPLTRRRIAELTASGTWTPTPAVLALLDDAAGLPVPPRTSVLHSDLHVRHVLVEGGRATGIIDWGDVCIGDPSVDLSIAYGAFGTTARAAFMATYGAIALLTELRARVIAVFLSAALLAYATDVGLDALRDESLAALDRAVN